MSQCGYVIGGRGWKQISVHFYWTIIIHDQCCDQLNMSSLTQRRRSQIAQAWDQLTSYRHAWTTSILFKVDLSLCPAGGASASHWSLSRFPLTKHATLSYGPQAIQGPGLLCVNTNAYTKYFKANNKSKEKLCSSTSLFKQNRLRTFLFVSVRQLIQVWVDLLIYSKLSSSLLICCMSEYCCHENWLLCCQHVLTLISSITGYPAKNMISTYHPWNA